MQETLKLATANATTMLSAPPGSCAINEMASWQFQDATVAE
jgi:hypothetical protein